MCMKCSHTRAQRNLHTTRAASTVRQQNHTIRHAPWPTCAMFRASPRHGACANEPRATEKKSFPQHASALFRGAFRARCAFWEPRWRALGRRVDALWTRVRAAFSAPVAVRRASDARSGAIQRASSSKVVRRCTFTRVTVGATVGVARGARRIVAGRPRQRRIAARRDERGCKRIDTRIGPTRRAAPKREGAEASRTRQSPGPSPGLHGVAPSRFELPLPP